MWVAPFGDPRIKGCSPLPAAFRSVPRPSSPLSTKASTRRPFQCFIPFFTHAQRTNQKSVFRAVSCIRPVQNSHEPKTLSVRTINRIGIRSIARRASQRRNAKIPSATGELRKPSALEPAHSPITEPMLVSCASGLDSPRKSSSTMSMNVRPLQKTDVRDRGSKPSITHV